MGPIPPPPTATSAVPPGVVLPTVLPLTTATSTPQQSAYQAGINANNILSERNYMLSAGSRRKKKGGATASTTTSSTAASSAASPSSYTVPQFNMLYNPNMGTGQSPNNIIQSSLGTMGQNTANSQYDSCVGQPAGCSGQLGGTKVCTSSNVNCWGCYSGGRKSRRKKKTERKPQIMKKKRRTNKKRRKHTSKRKN
jgi:hypothetical protein